METKEKTGKLLFTVQEVFSSDGFLKFKQKEFFNIPHYQRGYKWEPHNVEKLLQDISNFEGAAGKFYCLQNITIVANEDHFNVIDGQQRLTTLSIILSYLNEKNLVTNKVRFPENSIRKMTNQFLNTIVTNSSAGFPDCDWDEYISEQPQFDLQDIAHIFNIYRATEGWFSRMSSRPSFDLNDFKRKLLMDVQLIVNEVDGRTSEEKVFGNLNSKRVPLDGSDLIRAILITRVAREEGRKESDLKNIVYVNERRVKLGWELDQINNWWGREDVNGYFSKFSGIKSELVGGDKKLFNEEIYPINNLYLLYAESKGESKLALDLIEQNNNSAIGLYKDILKLHHTLQDWFQDKEVYHFLGFLFNQRKAKVTFKTIWNLWTKCDTRLAFLGELKVLIKRVFLVEDDLLVDFKDLRSNWYADKQDELIPALILMDIIHSIKKNQPNLPYNYFTKGTNDIEHIFPQKPKEIADKKAYLLFLNKYESDPKACFDLSRFDKMKDNEKYQAIIDSFIQEKTADLPINSIGNLVLLYNKLNKSISNSIYSSKRSRIIEYHSQGHFIQPHTFKVFTRDFNDEHQVNKDFEYWTKDDIKRNCAYIDQQINKFFNITS